MAPEQILNAADAGAPADLYSLGVILFHLLTGDLPFRGKRLEVLRKHVDEDPPPLPPLGGLEDLVAELLRKEPSARPTAQQVVARLERQGFVEEPPATHSTLTPMPQLPDTLLTKPARPSAVPLVASALAALFAAVAFAIAYRTSGPAPALEPPPPAQAYPSPAAAAALAAPPPASPPPPAATAPSPEAPADPAPPPSRRPRPSSPSKTPRDDGAGDRKIAAALSARALSSADLSSLAGVAAPLAEWRVARGSEGEGPALERLLSAIASAEIEPDLLERKLSALAADLGKLRGSIAAEPYQKLEQRYLDLRTAVRPGLDAAARSRLLGAIAAARAEARAAAGP
jgi:serine/threonine-protein kinase